MHLFLIRHSAIKNNKNICYGQMEMCLAEDFLSVSNTVCNKLPQLTHIYASPSQRCYQLADIIAQKDGNEVTKDARLLEFHYGEFEGKSWQELAIRADFQHWADNWHSVSTPQGESFTDFTTRVEKFLESLRASHVKDDNIAVVTHHGVLRAMTCHLLKIPVEGFFKLHFDYANVLQVYLGQSEAEDIFKPTG